MKRLASVHLPDFLDGPYPALIEQPGWMGYVSPSFDLLTALRIIEDLWKANGVFEARHDPEDGVIHLHRRDDEHPCSFPPDAEGRYAIGSTWRWEEYRPLGVEADPPAIAINPEEIRPLVASLLEQADPALILLVLADATEDRAFRATTVRDCDRWHDVTQCIRRLAPKLPYFPIHAHRWLTRKRKRGA